ncbi:RDD family protein [Chryseobacterium oranimense]|uniref:RDD family protein n=1 Tax=Chryseobacterium oranimense TaxID=421058 RepID=UPI000533A776|nr:RDD family protein [Chryseobacterium oranimense]CEJ71240.1 RDD family protein [Chryseobacterium oranimense G311]
MRKYLQIVDRHKATTGKRFLNLFLDRLFIQAIYYAFFFIFGIGYSIVYGEGFSVENEDQNLTFSLILIFIYLALSFCYFFFMEYYLGKTIAKYITGTEVISIDGNKPTPQQIITRTFSRAVPFDPLSFLGNNGWHDSWSDTRVINGKNYVAEKQLKEEISSIGAKEMA